MSLHLEPPHRRLPRSVDKTNTPPQAAEALLTYRETAELLGVTDRTVWQLVKDGDLVAVRFGRSVRIDPADLRSFIQQSKETATEVRRAD